MNVASLELCKELYELSGWDDVEHVYYSNAGKVNAENVWPSTAVFKKPGNIPAYDLGYLLRKEPLVAIRGTSKELTKIYSEDKTFEPWMAWYDVIDLAGMFGAKKVNPGLLKGKTPEDAVCKLIIKLFKAGILSNET